MDIEKEIEKLKSEMVWIDCNKKMDKRLNKLSNERKAAIKWNG